MSGPGPLSLGGVKTASLQPREKEPTLCGKKNLCFSVERLAGKVPKMSFRKGWVCLSFPGRVREGFLEEVVHNLSLEGWRGVYQLSKGERAS